MSSLPIRLNNYKPIEPFSGEPIYDFIGYREAQARWISDPTPANSRLLTRALEFEGRIPSDLHQAMPQRGR